MRASIPTNPYREPASLVQTEILPRRRTGVVAERLGLWRFAWVRRWLGGRWEKFLFVMWNRQEKPEWIPEGTFLLGQWRRVVEWSVVTSNRYEIGTMYCSQRLSDRTVFEGCALVTYRREDHG